MPKKAKPKTCPTCGAEFIPVIYGMPGSELFEAEERGEVVLGGCVPDFGPTVTWYCKGNPRHRIEEDRRGRLTVVESQDDDDLDFG